MVASIPRIQERGIAAVRVRLGWRGRPVLQVQRHRVSIELGIIDGIAERPARRSAWRDAGRADAIEVAQYLAELQAPTSVLALPPGGGYQPHAAEQTPPPGAE